MTDRRWRYPWQVVRLFHNGALIVVSSHRWACTAMVAAQIRDAVAWRSWPPRAHHDVRRTPTREERM